MPNTTNWDIEYPNGTTTPSVPAVMQAQAESVEAALNSIALAPLAICTNTGLQSTGTAGVFTAVRWANLHLQGITHASNDSTFVVSEAGIYQVNSRVAFYNNAVNVAAQVYVNGVAVVESLEDGTTEGGQGQKLRVMHYLKLQAGDAVHIGAYANTANIKLTGESTFQMAKIAGF